MKRLLLLLITTLFLTGTANTASTQKRTSTKDPIRTELIQEVDKYINSRFPKSRLSASTLVDICEKHNFDIVFAIAQGQIESGFGTAGLAKRTNSVWNVMSVKYTHPNHSIEPYIVLVKTKYLGSKKSVHDLMNNYVTLSGYRYASNRSYERTLKSTYNRICKQTKINELFDQLI